MTLEPSNYLGPFTVAAKSFHHPNVGNPEIEVAVLSGLPVLQIGQDFHVAFEARRATGEVLRNKRISLLGMLSQANQLGIGRTIEALWVGEGLGKILLGEAKELFLVNVLSLLFAHWVAVPTSIRWLRVCPSLARF